MSLLSGTRFPSSILPSSKKLCKFGKLFTNKTDCSLLFPSKNKIFKLGIQKEFQSAIQWQWSISSCSNELKEARGDISFTREYETNNVFKLSFEKPLKLISFFPLIITSDSMPLPSRTEKSGLYHYPTNKAFNDFAELILAKLYDERLTRICKDGKLERSIVHKL